MNGKFPHVLYCRLTKHDWEYTDEYANTSGNVQADKICLRCLKAEMAWVGPEVTTIEEVCEITVPSCQRVYRDIGVDIRDVWKVNN